MALFSIQGIYLRFIMWVVRCRGVIIYMRFFDYIDTIEKPTIDNIRVIYKAVNEKYDDLIDMALEPNSKNYKKWVQNMECLKKSENMMIDCIGNKQITDTEWLELMYNIYRYQVKYGGLKYLTIEL